MRLRGLLLICLAAMSWGTTGAVTAVLARDAGASPLVVGSVRMIVAAAVLVVAARLATGRTTPAAGARGTGVALGLCMAAFQVTYFTAVTLIGVAISALVAICCAPLIITALAAARLHERLTRRGGLALALGVTGTALLVVGPRTTADLTPRFAAGVGLALAAAVSYALYVVLAKAALARAAPLPLAGATFTAAAVVLAPALLTADAPRQIAAGWPWLLYLGAVTTAGAYAAHTIGLRHVPASAAGVAALLEPLTAALLGVVAFGEHLGGLGALGAGLLLGALGVLLGAPAARPRPDEDAGVRPRARE